MNPILLGLFAAFASPRLVTRDWQRPGPRNPFGCSMHPAENRRNKAAKRKRRAAKVRRKAAARARRITVEARRVA